MSAHMGDSAAWTNLICAVHDAPVACVMELAGAGTQALAWLHAVEGSASTVLEAHDRYHADTLAAVLSATPARATDPAVAVALAAAALERARALCGDRRAVIGLGCTAALVTARQRRGLHVCHVVTADGLASRRLDLRMTKGARDRAEEEEVAARLLLSALATAAGVDSRLIPPWQEPELVQVEIEAGMELAALLAGGAEVVYQAADGTVLVDPPASYRSRVGALLSGSFDPLHDGHRGLAAAAAEYIGTEVVFELPVMNADKSPLEAGEAHRRASPLMGRAELWLTRAALYTQKAQLFPGAVFVVGADTAERVLQPRFYGGERQMHEAVSAIGAAGCRFLVAARPMPDGLLTLGRIPVPAGIQPLFRELPADRFCLDQSSTRIRTELAAVGHRDPPPAGSSLV